jgi:uncharacterized protein YlbG (UPF0298 family)
MAIKSITKEQFEKGLVTLVKTNADLYNVAEKDVEKYIEDWNKLIDTYPDEVSYLDRALELRSCIALHFSKSLVRTIDLDEVNFFAGQKPNDFGKTKKIKEALVVYETNKATAIQQGLTNDKGEVLEQFGFNKGKPVDMENLFQRTVIGSVMIEGKLKPAYITLKGKLLNADIKAFSKVKLKNVILASAKENRKIIEGDIHNKWKEKYVNIYITDDTIIEFVGLFDESDIIKHIESGMLKSYTEETFESIAKKRANKQYDDFFVKKVHFKSGDMGKNGSTLMQITLANDSSINDVEDVFSAREETIIQYTGWYEGELLCMDEVSDAYIIGDSYTKNNAEKTIQLNIFGVWFPEKFNRVIPDKNIDKEIDEIVKPKSDDKVETKATPKKETKKEDVEVETEDEDGDDW